MIGDDLIISIHALLAESDFIWVDKTQSPANFYPRSPCGERQAVCNQLLFDTLISIHALLAESDSQPCCTDTTSTISIHALLAESDLIRPYANFAKPGFLSTLSLRRATVVVPGPPIMIPISIHALLAESDNFRCSIKCAICNFYPRSPCGERLTPARMSSRLLLISIHALLAESDSTTANNALKKVISIHALLAESDGISPDRCLHT